MNTELPQTLMDAMDELSAIPWEFEDRIDSDELDRLCHQYLEDWQDHFGWELLLPEENFQWESYRRFYFVRKHWKEFTRLCEGCYQFVDELTRAGGQHLLGQRAMLKEALSSQRPSALVRYRSETLPVGLSLNFVDYEKDAGGGSVFAARLLWWGAAGKDSESFDYSSDFPLEFAGLPIWTCMQPAEHSRSMDPLLIVGSANLRPVEAIRQTVRAVCDLFTGHENDGAAGYSQAKFTASGAEDSPGARRSPEAAGGSPQFLDDLNETQLHILQSIDNEQRRGPEIAKRSGYEHGTVRKVLPELIRRGLVRKGGRGYRRP